MPMFKYETKAWYQDFARKADHVMAWASIPFAAFMFWFYWPRLGTLPDGVWPWVSLAMIPVSFWMARFDWKTALEDWLRTRIALRR